MAALYWYYMTFDWLNNLILCALIAVSLCVCGSTPSRCVFCMILNNTTPRINRASRWILGKFNGLRCAEPNSVCVIPVCMHAK